MLFYSHFLKDIWQAGHGDPSTWEAESAQSLQQVSQVYSTISLRPYIKLRQRGWRVDADGSVVKSACCFRTGPGVSSQHHTVDPNHQNSSPRGWQLFWLLWLTLTDIYVGSGLLSKFLHGCFYPLSFPPIITFARFSTLASWSWGALQLMSTLQVTSMLINSYAVSNCTQSYPMLQWTPLHIPSGTSPEKFFQDTHADYKHVQLH